MATKQSAWRSPWVIGFLMMGVIFVGANVYLIWLSGTNPPNLVVEDYYERGQDYEQNMLKRMAKDSNWVMELMPPQKVVMNEPAEFNFVLLDKDAKVVNPDSVTLYAYRPSDASADFAAPMEPLSAGQYRVSAKFPLKGVWDLLVSVKQGEDEHHTSLRINVDVN